MNEFRRSVDEWLDGDGDGVPGRTGAGPADELIRDLAERMVLHQLLRESYAEQPIGARASDGDAGRPEFVDSRASWRRLKRRPRTALAAAIVVAIGIGLGLGLGPAPDAVATIDAGASDVRLVDGAVDGGRAAGRTLFAGDRVRLAAGHATLPFAGGAIVTLAGPADLEVRTGDHAILHRGQLMATVGRAARGFTVGTPSADIVDLGTHFGVNVGASGQTHVIVFEGLVEVRAARGGRPASGRNRLSVGEAAYIDENGTFHRFHAIR